MRILLACASGFSTSILVERMKSYVQKEKLDITIDAVSEGRIASVIEDFDMVLLGPQVSHLEQKYRKEFQDLNIPIQTISMMDYGMMDGEKVIKQALKLIRKE
jgi:cellobiose PTS system EIIB component